MMPRTIHRAALAAAVVLLAVTAASAQQAAARVYGTVVDEKGEPVAKAKIVLEPAPGAQGNRTFNETNRKGTYLFGIVRPGTYLVKVDVPGKVIVNVKARAVDIKKVEQWVRDGRPRPGQDPTIDVDDGFEVTMDLTVGEAIAIASAEGQAQQMTPEQALSAIAAQIQKGDCAGAMPLLDKVLEANAGLALGHYLRGFCLGSQEKDEEADSALAKALELNPKFEGAAVLRGHILRRMGKPADAEAMYKQELDTTQNPQLRTDAFIGLGLVYEDQKKDEQALEAFQQVTTLAPSRPEPYLEMAAIHTRLNQPDKAKAVLDQAQQMGASSPEAILNIGITYFNKKDYAKSGEMFQQVMTMPGAAPADVAMAYALDAKLLLREGKNNEAIAAMKKSLELDPKGPLAQETRDLLKAMGGK